MTKKYILKLYSLSFLQFPVHMCVSIFCTKSWLILYIGGYLSYQSFDLILTFEHSPRTIPFQPLKTTL